ncbi:ABC transporter substrate-binding protein [Nakamurella flava]|uniref:ABC transporter substrate-binding protein n=1 Tax=Nakamurella flava TaxID=2576308 RepID=A0A4U6QBM0_9ACTN|nr:ABC transporter substrate-binding protein [Nakamurella flava]
MAVSHLAHLEPPPAKPVRRPAEPARIRNVPGRSTGRAGTSRPVGCRSAPLEAPFLVGRTTVFKKTWAIAAAAGLALTLAACGGNSSTASSSSVTSDGTSKASSSAAASGSSGSSGAAPASGELPPIDPTVLDGAVIGFAQVGSESGWRSANTDDIKRAAEANKVDLQFTSAEGDQAKQIASIKTYITQGVDVIAFSPVVETGWDSVLQEAKAADIPVILTDRAVDSDPSLYKTFIGSDFVAEGEKAANWAKKEFADASSVNVVVLEGTTGSAPANDRATGWKNVLGSDTKFKTLASQTGDFTRDGGKKVMEGFLAANPDIQLVYAHNDDMALGAIEAIEAAGKVPGKDIKIVSIDGVKAGMEALAAGKINYIVECSPLLGNQLFQAASAVLKGDTIPTRIVTVESEFDQAQAQAALPDRQY